MYSKTATRSLKLREKLDHPVIDADGHEIEMTPILMDYLKQVGGSGIVERYKKQAGGSFFKMTPQERRDVWAGMPPWWAFPARNTLDRATVSLPKLLYQRLDDMGIDFCILYPSIGMGMARGEDDEVRRAACRAFNTYQAEMYREYSGRITPVAVIPMHTPQEAIAELEHAVTELGLKVILINGYVRRPVAKIQRERPDLVPLADRLDTFGVDSAYDYDPVWAKCVELKVAVTSHSGTQGWGARRSPSLYMFNQTGHFGEAAEILAKSLFLGGVTRRFPDLNFAFLEGGVGWACVLYAGMLGRWKKRGGKAIAHLDPASIDQELLKDLLTQHGGPKVAEKLEAIHRSFVQWGNKPDVLDDWAACGVEQARDIRDLFTRNFYFGCEADDPINAWAFNTRVNPFGARLHAMLGSDIGHWDVPDMTQVLEEAHELLEEGLVSPGDFKDFAFGNAVRLHAGMNPDFFKGTRVEAQASQFMLSHPPSPSLS